MKHDNLYRSVLFGVAVGDALGVPVEFRDRETIRKNPVTTMIGYGTYNLPPGTWSDDSSLTFCLAEALTHEFSLQRIADNFVQWLYHTWWTPYGKVFDVGIMTQEAIYRLKNGTSPELAGGFAEDENGNGSLMRILPLLFYIHNKPVHERFLLTKQVSSLTHGHIRSVIACFYYLEFARYLMLGEDKFAIYNKLQKEIPEYLHSLEIVSKEIDVFNRLLREDIQQLPEEKIYSSGYVLHSLEAAVWCLLTTDSYPAATLKAVNLGSDTDTTAAITGGLAGLLYGFEGIPSPWVKELAKQTDIDELAFRSGIYYNPLRHA